MKVACYFGGRTNLGGAERRIGRIMNQIAKKGIEVIFVFFLYEKLCDIEKEYQKFVGEPLLIKLKGFDSQRELFDYVCKQHFDTIFYTGSYKAMLPFFFAGKLTGSQTVFLQVSTGPSVRQFGSIAEMLEFELVARLSDRIDCLYPSTTEAIDKRYKRQIVTTTPCPATDLHLYMPCKKRRRIAFISRWIPGKNVELFLESMIIIEEQLFEQKYEVLLCGSSRDGVVEGNVKEILKKARHPEIFVLPGYVQSIDILPSAEMFFSLQNINNYPSQSLLEAIACGCYIIASDEGDTSILVKDEFGKCIRLNNDDITSETLKFIYTDYAEKKRIVNAARRFAEETFDINRSVDHYENIIKSGKSISK